MSLQTSSTSPSTNVTTTTNNQTQSTPPAVQTGSLVAVLSKLSGKKVTADQLTNMKFSEEILYASSVHSELSKTSKPLLQTFMSELKERYDRRIKRNDTQPIAKAINDILDNGVKGKKITQKQYETILAKALGNSQVDKNKAAVGNQIRTGGMDKATSLTKNNTAATKKAVDAFEKSVSTLKFQAPATTRTQVANMQKIFDSLKKATPKTPKPETSTKPSNSDETGTVKTNTPDPTKDSSPNHFDFRIKSDVDGKLLVRLPITFRQDIESVSLVDSNGKVLEEQPLKQKGEDNRYYFRFTKAGDKYADSLEVRINYQNGTQMPISIKDARSNYSQEYQG
jgi:hypothetical protein